MRERDLRLMDDSVTVNFHKIGDEMFKIGQRLGITSRLKPVFSARSRAATSRAGSMRIAAGWGRRRGKRPHHGRRLSNDSGRREHKILRLHIEWMLTSVCAGATNVCVADSKSCEKIDGGLSGWFKVKQGQGCGLPGSGWLFAV
mmetsp:Transcript_3907/g.9927  ORF Transcript_3907/g.9927 Transcript_3907/m.9927 type:complete len:144 (+) Transcript_3907:1059-1490(+)